MNKIKISLVAAALLLSGQTFAQTTKATIQGEISSSTANGLLGGTILNNIVLSYVDWTTCSGTGGIVYWNAGTPTCLNAGTNGYTLTMVSGIPQWTLPASGTGTVTSIATNNGITGGTITTSGTIGLANITTGNVMANVSGVTTYPTPTTPSAVLDVIGSTEGSVLYRGASTWLALTPGTNGQLLATGGIGSTPSWTTPPTPRGTVKIQRVLPLPSTYGTATWAAYDAFSNIICSGTANTTALDNCVIAALNTAFPYALNTPNSGYDFELIGGDEPGSGSPGSHHYGGGGAELSSNTGPFHFPPIQNGNIRIGAVSLVTSGNADALVFDACEMCDINFLGAQTVAGGTGLGLRIKPTLGTPVDNGVAFSPSRAIFSTIGGPTRLDLSGNASANIDYANIEIIENNLGTATVTCGFLIDSPAVGQNMGANTIKVDQLHGLGTAVTTMFCNGTQAPGGGAILGRSKFDIGIGLDTAGGTNGFDEWGSNDEIYLHVTGLSTGYTLKFESGACNNVAYIWSSQATPTITDSSGCTGANANIWYVNGSLTIGGNTTVNASGFTGPGLAISGTKTFSQSLSADVVLNNVSAYFDGPGINIGTGLWCASGTVTAFDTAGAATLKAKLWDGTNIAASAIIVSSSASNPVNMALSGCFNNPVGGVIKISVNDSTATTGLIKFNSSGNSHDSTISAWRVF